MYIKLLLGEEIKDPNTNCYLSREIVEKMYENKARILIEKPNAVELFYVRTYRLFLKKQEKIYFKNSGESSTSDTSRWRFPSTVSYLSSNWKEI